MPVWRGAGTTDPQSIAQERPAPSPGGYTDLTRTMNLSSLLYPATVRAHVQLDSKKALFPFVGDLAARSLGLDSGEVSEALLERERLGSTGFGRGIALPHAKMADLGGVRDIHRD